LAARNDGPRAANGGRDGFFAAAVFTAGLFAATLLAAGLFTAGFFAAADFAAGLAIDSVALVLCNAPSYMAFIFASKTSQIL
jgi:hypothetical protein